NTDDLGLDVTDVVPDADGLIPVDGARRAGRHILAIGDITAGPALAHKATAEAEVAARTAAGKPAVFDPACVPAVVFSDPEVATVGYTEAEATAAGIQATKTVFPIGASARARTLGPAAGQVELISDDAGTIIGAHIAGPLASELIGEAALAVEMAATVEDLAATVHAHPTMSESLAEAAHASLGLPLHMVQRR
ncbi:MAG: dihydrolipoyl dehydrogenase, partial [Actinomycetota bacterium]